MNCQFQSKCSFLVRLTLHTTLAVAVALAIPVQAQNSQGTIVGHVMDQAGASVVGAQVTVTNVANSITHKTKTSGAGDFVVVNLPPGNYNIVAEAPAFKKSQALAVRLDVEATLRQDFQLQVGTVTEQVTVESQTQMVQSDNVTSGRSEEHTSEL